jgi:hypothetical protein
MIRTLGSESAIAEFVLDWPDESGIDAFEAAAREVLPGSQPGA